MKSISPGRKNIMNLKSRILTGWNWVRVLYLLAGLYVVVQSALDREWYGMLFGGYFASMGLLAFGCASGACFGGSCETKGEKQIAD